ATDTSTWYVDRDGDGHGDPNSTVSACQDEGFLEDNTDCDDGNSTVHPNALEICDQIDNNCNGLIDDADPNLDPGATTRWFIDADGDGLGSPDLTAETCLPPSGYQLTDLDCDDGNPAIHPSQVEICDGIDNDCDGAIDDEDPNVYLGTAPVWYSDVDNDTFGSATAVAVSACAASPGMVSNNDDCDDSNDLVSPDATEICDGVDNDCDGSTDVEAGDATTWYLDADEDGWG
ncbi:MAG: putative metal-binding motif-containing protein, partial [Myxococcota bacterium]|nr:putative metal-binding motif-containing protein [Myxococcota bacterium]